MYFTKFIIFYHKSVGGWPPRSPGPSPCAEPEKNEKDEELISAKMKKFCPSDQLSTSNFVKHSPSLVEMGIAIYDTREISLVGTLNHENPITICDCPLTVISLNI